MLFRIENLHKNYGDRPVLTNLSLSVQDREFVSLVGKSGCGKTTLLKIISGLSPYEEGKITWSQHSYPHKIGYVFQSPTLLPWLNVRDNIQLSAKIAHVDGSIVNKTASLIKMIGLTGYENFYPDQLSGGMQQKVAIARSLLTTPNFLLMDEPFSHLDEITRHQLTLELAYLWETAETNLSGLLYVTHSIQESLFLSDRLLILSGQTGSIQHEVEVNLPRPRTEALLYSKAYLTLVRKVRNYLK